MPLGGPGHPAKRSTVGRTERGLGLSWWVLLPWTHPRTEAREDKVQRQEERCVPPCSASGPSSRTGVEGSGFGNLLQNQAWPEEGLWLVGGCCRPELGVWGWLMVWGVSLTCTHSYCVPRVVPTVVAVEAPVGVADRSFCAIVPQLLGTHLTTLTAVRDEADAHWAAGRGRRALARPLAKLRARGVLQRGRGGAHGRGGWRQGLWREGRHKGACPEEGSQAKGPQSPSHLYGVPKVHVKFQFSAMLWMARHLLSPH